MADIDPVPITDENAAAHAIAAAIHDITKQDLPGHGHEIVKQRLIRAGSVVRASVCLQHRPQDRQDRTRGRPRRSNRTRQAIPLPAQHLTAPAVTGRHSPADTCRD
ncbi:hypothetical protein [Streptomyces sp. IB201691-2A2]|uniref:hypothetical protein n=1 Tax=Streptomyces sp. IB201691-2A2 TaxID=2561920 RepID=UPI00117D62A0|nr:hypothetical protein [Streptomyces sp. IB201691-2A2]TRO57090.1 hypothetical protein E4K73_44095 [Streptomyces sp. IB201691-2A2]